MMLFRMKLRQEMTNTIIGGHFNIDERKVEEVFEIAITFVYDSSLRIPRAWTRSDLTDEQRDQIYSEINSTLDPFHETLRQAFDDPSGNGREACIILMDSSKFPTEKAFDKALQVCFLFCKESIHLHVLHSN